MLTSGGWHNESQCCFYSADICYKCVSGVTLGTVYAAVRNKEEFLNHGLCVLAKVVDDKEYNYY